MSQKFINQVYAEPKCIHCKNTILRYTYDSSFRLGILEHIIGASRSCQTRKETVVTIVHPNVTIVSQNRKPSIRDNQQPKTAVNQKSYGPVSFETQYYNSRTQFLLNQKLL